MPAAADLTESSWKVFSALLDRALELAPSDRLAWLDTLDAEHDASEACVAFAAAALGGR